MDRGRRGLVMDRGRGLRGRQGARNDAPAMYISEGIRQGAGMS